MASLRPRLRGIGGGLFLFKYYESCAFCIGGAYIQTEAGERGMLCDLYGLFEFEMTL